MKKRVYRILTGTSGLNTNADPAHLTPTEDGRRPLLSCLNVYVGDTGRINRCAGAVKVWDESEGWE